METNKHLSYVLTYLIVEHSEVYCGQTQTRRIKKDLKHFSRSMFCTTLCSWKRFLFLSGCQRWNKHLQQRWVRYNWLYTRNWVITCHTPCLNLFKRSSSLIILRKLSASPFLIKSFLISNSQNLFLKTRLYRYMCLISCKVLVSDYWCGAAEPSPFETLTSKVLNPNRYTIELSHGDFTWKSNTVLSTSKLYIRRCWCSRLF